MRRRFKHYSPKYIWLFLLIHVIATVKKKKIC